MLVNDNLTQGGDILTLKSKIVSIVTNSTVYTAYHPSITL